MTSGLFLEAEEGVSLGWQSPVAREAKGFLLSHSCSEFSGLEYKRVRGEAQRLRPDAGVSGTSAPTLFGCVCSHVGVPQGMARDAHAHAAQPRVSLSPSQERGPAPCGCPAPPWA